MITNTLATADALSDTQLLARLDSPGTREREATADLVAFVSMTGRRCTERTFLEYHHRTPYALAGPATVENIMLACRRHNSHEAERVFGPIAESRRARDAAIEL